MKYVHLLLLSSAFLTSPALAQTIDPDADPETSTTSIVVTGNRATDPVPIDQVGGSVTILDQQVLDRRQVREVSDVLRDVPGVAVGRVPGQTQIRLRGAEANHTLVLIDGIEVSDPYAGEFDFGTLIADEAARIEVLRGQQSAIYGSDAIGGVIQYITLGGRDAPGAAARIEAGSFGTLNGAARIAGYSGDLDYALSATLNTTDGTPGARGGTRDLANDSGAVSLKTTFAPTSDARLTGVLRYARTDAEFNDSDSDPASPTFGFQVDSPGNRFQNEAVYALVRGEVDLLDDRWTHALSAQIADTRRDGFASTGRSYGSEGQRLKGSYDTTLRIEAGGLTHRVTAALDVERERFRNTDPTGFAFTGRRQIDNIGLVGQYAIDLGDRASASASIRRDWNDQFADTTTYRLQASYRIAAATRVRGAAGSGVKNPSFYELYGFVDGRFIGNPDLRPEKSSGWEIGIDQSLFGERASIGVTYFESELDDEIFTSFPPPNFVASPSNRDTVSERNGVEVSGEARLGEAWRVNGAYTYLRSRENGTREVRRPSHTASLAVDWRVPGDAGGVTLVARYNVLESLPAFSSNQPLTLLDISNNHLSDLPASIGNLTLLQSLDVGTNKLTTLPESTTKLANLRTLVLRENQLAALPSTLELSALSHLDVSTNQLTELPPNLGYSLKSLIELDCSHNLLTSFPPSIGQLPCLQKLFFFGCCMMLYDFVWCCFSTCV